MLLLFTPLTATQPSPQHHNNHHRPAPFLHCYLLLSILNTVLFDAPTQKPAPVTICYSTINHHITHQSNISLTSTSNTSFRTHLAIPIKSCSHRKPHHHYHLYSQPCTPQHLPLNTDPHLTNQSILPKPPAHQATLPHLKTTLPDHHRSTPIDLTPLTAKPSHHRKPHTFHSH
ncbi:hypothetical protein NE237_019036 [Protea cynaroides]|uniref:Uncharacterized protein n=1 Tax=Protea cynaroides TaxID=273540 RepID=A0A9Q0KB16_9MAGN|nr:hypothetical protein NE237_019036 [Protea cynaroides]